MMHTSRSQHDPFICERKGDSRHLQQTERSLPFLLSMRSRLRHHRRSTRACLPASHPATSTLVARTHPPPHSSHASSMAVAALRARIPQQTHAQLGAPRRLSSLGSAAEAVGCQSQNLPPRELALRFRGRPLWTMTRSLPAYPRVHGALWTALAWPRPRLQRRAEAVAATGPPAAARRAIALPSPLALSRSPKPASANGPRCLRQRRCEHPGFSARHHSGVVPQLCEQHRWQPLSLT